MAKAPLSTSALASVALHGVLLALLVRAPPPRRFETVAIEVVARPAPPRPPVEAPERARPATPRVAAALPADAPLRRTPEPEAPPPPNEPPPPDAAPPARAPVKVGISLSSTSAGGGFAAPVGNTLYGELPKVAPPPEEVKPYAAPKYVPPTQVTALPRVVRSEIPASEYPAEALRLGLEARVVVRTLVDETGQVVEAIALNDPGNGFAEAAVRSVRTYYRFEPARRGDEAVATWIRIPVNFELP